MKLEKKNNNDIIIVTAAYYDYLKLPGYFILTFKMFDKSGKKTFKNLKKFVPESKNKDDDKLNFFPVNIV